MMLKAPLIKPDDPAPAIARPIISMLDDCAAPHSTEPISNRAKKVSQDHLEMISTTSIAVIDKCPTSLETKVLIYLAGQGLQGCTVISRVSNALYPLAEL